MVKKKPIVTVLGTLGTLIFLAGLVTTLGLFAPHYAFFWALACWAIAGGIQRFAKEETKGEGRN